MVNLQMLNKKFREDVMFRFSLEGVNLGRNGELRFLVISTVN